jgi:hypothetical protein
MLKVSHREGKAASNISISNIKDEINERLSNIKLSNRFAAIPKPRKSSLTTTIPTISPPSSNNSPMNFDFNNKVTPIISLSANSSPVVTPRTNTTGSGLNRHYMNFLSQRPTRSISNPRIGKGKKISPKDEDGSLGFTFESNVSAKSTKSVRFREKLVEDASPREIYIHKEDVPHLNSSLPPVKKILKSCLKSPLASPSISPEACPSMNTTATATTSSYEHKTTSLRPSFSEQLSKITDNVTAVTTKLQENHHMLPPTSSISSSEIPLLIVPIRAFTVGSLSCKHPSNVKFYSYCLEYTFYHPYEASEILLVMYYRDFVVSSFHQANTANNIRNSISSSSSSSNMNNNALQGNAKFSFRLPKKLLCFIHDFDPMNPLHTIMMDMYTSIAIIAFKENILPIIKSKRQQLNPSIATSNPIAISKLTK